MADIELPHRGVGSSGRRRGGQLPDAGDVPNVNMPRDPGLNVPRIGGGEGLESAGQGLTLMAEKMAAAGDRIRTRGEAVNRARAVSQFNQDANAELRRLESEEDLTRSEVLTAYGDFLSKRQADLITQFGGGEDSRMRLLERLEGIRGAYADMGGQASHRAQTKLVEGTMGENLGRLTARAGERPNEIKTLFDVLDADIDDMGPALSPEQETAFRSAGRREIVLSAFNSFVSRGAVTEAKNMLAEAPYLREMLTPEQQRSIDGRIAAAEKAKNDAANEGKRKLEIARQILGRDPTLAERLQIAGVAMKEGKQTAADKIADIEAALGPLTPEQKARALGVDKPQAQTGAGKVVQDRELFVSQYGEGSPQVKAFDELTTAAEEAPKLSDVAGARKEFTSQSQDFVKVRDAYNRITASAKNPSAAGDLALIFNYMKMLDPGSTVREGEFATAQNSAGVPERIVAQYNKVLSGERLAPETRTDFVSRSKSLMDEQLKTHLQLEDQFRGIATNSGFDPGQVVIDFVGPLRPKKGAAQPQPGASGGPQGPTETPPTVGLPDSVPGVIEYGIDGKRITPGGQTADKAGKKKKDG